MRRIPVSPLLLLTIAASAVSAQSTVRQASLPPGISWGPAPAVFPAGAEMAVLQGNPAGNGLFTVRLRLPDGYRVPPHTHPTDEQVTVISGSFLVGMGTTVDPKSMSTLTPGAFVVAPANHAHYAGARGETVVQIHAMGPFALTYVNPADAPRAATSR